MTTDTWAHWENRIVHGGFPLRRLLGSSNHSAVFLTEHKSKGVPDAAIKLVRAEGLLQAKDQLAQWQAAAASSHPHLVRLFNAGRCQLDGQEFLFVVMEHADQTLAQILRHRALTADEALELLVPTLDALSFLHRNQLVHGQLKPSNFLAVGDQLKLASDTIRPPGSSASGRVRTSAYDPPELKDGVVGTAGDIWSLGVTLVEALTQRTPALSERQSEAASLAASLPVQFAYNVRRCLSISAADRPTVADLSSQYSPAPPAPPQPVPASQPSSSASTSTQAVQPRSFPAGRWSLAAIAVALVIALVMWMGSRPSDTPQDQLPPVVVPEPPPAAPPRPIAKQLTPAPIPISRPPAQPSLPPADSSILHEAKPDVPKKISDKIQGRIYVTVRVLVDPAGNVFGALMENPGPSKYFARLSDNASREWQFVPTDSDATRVWLLRFEYRRDGISVRAIAQ